MLDYDFITCPFNKIDSTRTLIKIIPNKLNLQSKLTMIPVETNFLFMSLVANIGDIRYMLKLSNSQYSYYVVGNRIDFDFLIFLFGQQYPIIPLTEDIKNFVTFYVMDHQAHIIDINNSDAKNVIEICDEDNCKCILVGDNLTTHS